MHQSMPKPPNVRMGLHAILLILDKSVVNLN